MPHAQISLRPQLRMLAHAITRLSTLLGMTLLLFLWIGAGLYIRLDREKTIEASEQETRNLARLFEEHVSRSIKEIDQTIQFVRRSYERDPQGFDLPGWTATEGLLHDLTVQMALIGPDGHMIATNVSRAPAKLDLSDREHFRVHLNTADDKLFISKPVLGRATNKWTIQLTRRMSKPDGSFDGVIVASLDPYYLSRFFEQIDIGPKGAITLLGTDGIIRARGGTMANQLGRSLEGTDVFRHIEQDRTGTRIGEGNATRGVRIISFRTMKDFPLAVMVAEAEDDVLADFGSRQTIVIVTAGALSIVLLIVMGVSLRHEIRMLQARSAQRKSEARERRKTLELEATLHHMSQGIVMIDAKRQLRVINPLAIRLLDASDVPSIGETLPGEIEAVLARADAKSSDGSRVEMDLGNGIIVQIARQDMPDGGYLYGLTDISEHKRAESILADARDRAEAGVRARTSFLATMSHEIRTPLNGVIGMTHLLESCTEEERTVYFQTMRKSAEHLQQIIEDILDVSKLEADRMVFDFLPFTLVDVVKASVGMVEAAAYEKALDLSVSIDPSLPARLMGDPGRIRQVILNLVGNAVKFTSAGSVRVSVDKVASEPIPCLRIRVSDTGIGIAPEDRERLFHDFAQLDGSITRQFGGTGLGLAISRKLVENMGGEIAFESERGKGTTFTVLLPLAEAPQQESETLPLLTRYSAQAADRNRTGYDLLLAEDSPTNTLVATKLLEKLGHRVTAVPDGAEAINALGRQYFDAVFMDVMMPRMDGLTATRLIRRSGQPYSNIPIIALTAAAQSDDRDEAFAAGVNAFATKPVGTDQLKAALDDVFQPDVMAS